MGSWDVEQKGEDVLVLAVGPMTYTSLEATKKTILKNYKIEVVNCRFIKPMDVDYLLKIKDKFSKF